VVKLRTEQEIIKSINVLWNEATKSQSWEKVYSNVRKIQTLMFVINKITLIEDKEITADGKIKSEIKKQIGELTLNKS